MSATQSLYLPYKSLGLICDSLPFTYSKLGDEQFITVGVENHFQVYRLDKLTVCMVSKPTPGRITNIAVKNHDTFVSVGNAVYKFRRVHMIGKVLEMESEIRGLLSIGDVLLCYDSCNVLKVVDTKSSSVVSEISFLHPSKVSVVMHPISYLNKFLIGFEDGHLELWNIRSCKMIYSFNSIAKIIEKSPITSISQSPACDVIGIGFGSGEMIVLNIKLDVILFHFKQKGSVTSMSFRSDPLTNKFPYIISSSNHGHIYIWMIENVLSEASSRAVAKLQDTIIHAHSSSISKVEFLPGEPVFVSNGEDNSIKVWIFDNPDGSPRLLKFRHGHSKYSRKLKYYGDITSNSLYHEEVYGNLQGLISADDDGRIIFTRIEKDYDFQEFSQSSLDKKDQFSKSKLPKCVDFDFTYVGSKPWGDMVSIHEKKRDAFIWKVENKAVTPTVLKYSEFNSSPDVFASAVAVSVCGHFAVVGYSNGIINKYNIQSGLLRGQFKNPSGEASCRITGLFVDSSNSSLVSINSAGELQFWNFTDQSLKHTEKLPYALEILVGNRENNFVAIADEKFVVRLFDIDTFNLCRLFFTKHVDTLSSLVFSIDGHHLVSSGMDGSVQVWDISSTRLLSWIKFDSPVSSIVLAPNGDLLVARKNQKALLLCADRSLTENVNFVQEPREPTLITEELKLPDLMQSESNEIAETSYDSFCDSTDSNRNTVGLTFSNVSKSYWSALCNMELMQKRNKLIKPTEKVVVPFFIPSQFPELNAILPQPDGAQQVESKIKSRILKHKSSFRSAFAELLSGFPESSGSARKLYAEKVLSCLLNMTPAQVDVQFQSLLDDSSLENGLTQTAPMKNFLSCLSILLEQKSNFEVIQAFVYRIISIHGTRLTADSSFSEEIVTLREKLESNGENLQNLLHLTLCLVKTALNLPSS